LLPKESYIKIWKGRKKKQDIKATPQIAPSSEI
jgi:hypothetical protein